METLNCDVLIIGAGPAGVISASILHNKGYKVKVVEKQLFPRFVIGESLLPRCMDHLDEAGLLDVVKEKGFQQKFGAIFYREENFCDFDFSTQFTKGWDWTWQVPRADFDKTLADAIAAKGVSVSYQMSVEAVSIENDIVTTTVVDEKTKESSVIKSKFIIDSSGYGRVLPKLFDLDQPSNFPPRAAYFTHIKEKNRPDGPQSNRITVVALSDDIWVWNIPFSNGITSVGFVGDPSFHEKFTGATEEERFRKMLKELPALEKRYEGDDFAFEPRSIVGYSISVKKFHGNRFVLTGNSTEFLDPIFSSGVTFAMESGSLAAKLVDRELKGEKVDWESDFVDHMKQGVDTFRSYVEAWYSGDLQKIFFASQASEEIKAQICSVLAGYVWDQSNPFVKKHKTILKTLSQVIDIENARVKA